MPYAPLNHRDKTAEKIPAGIGAFCAPAGYAQVVCCPFIAIGLLIAGIGKAIEKRRQKKAAADPNAAKSAPAGETNNAEQQQKIAALSGTKSEGDDNAREKEVQPQTETSESKKSDGENNSVAPATRVHIKKKVPEVAPLDEKLVNDLENPRVCDPECPGFGKERCAVHDRKIDERPKSPGLLAV